MCLRAIERRGRRALPAGLGPPGDDPEGPVAAAARDVAWLQPFPGPVNHPEPTDPAAVAASRAGMRLALIASLQYLSAWQRAVLILRDVLDWPAAETAQVLGTTTAVNSELRRARAHLERVVPAAEDIAEPADPRQRELARLSRVPSLRRQAFRDNAEQSGGQVLVGDGAGHHERTGHRAQDQCCPLPAGQRADQVEILPQLPGSRRCAPGQR